MMKKILVCLVLSASAALCQTPNGDRSRYSACPLTAAKIIPRTFNVRVNSPAEGGWRYSTRMVVLVDLKNATGREINQASISLYDGIHHWSDNDIDIPAGQSKEIILPEISPSSGKRSPIVLGKIRYANGQIEDHDCVLGYAEVPPFPRDPTPDAEIPNVTNKIGGTVTPPKLLYSVPPQYSQEARAAHKSGSVLVHCFIDKVGDTRDATVVRGIGYGLDEEARKAIQQYHFLPALRDGEPVVSEINIEVNFTTDTSASPKKRDKRFLQ